MNWEMEKLLEEGKGQGKWRKQELPPLCQYRANSGCPAQASKRLSVHSRLAVSLPGSVVTWLCHYLTMLLPGCVTSNELGALAGHRFLFV